MATSSFLPLFTIKAVRTPAADRVLGLGELVEAILLHLTPPDIVICRRVSKKFLETVTYSKAVRQLIFVDSEPQSERTVNPLAPAWFHQQRNGYRDSTIAARINILDLWENSGAETRPLWDKMLISQPPTTTCVIPVGNHLTIFFRRYYPEGMTFGDLERAVIAAFEIRKGRKSSRERLEDLSNNNSVLIYWR
ncbi:hypothetical protein M409DRAFT_59655 [Zasmidium cellare ATCC 36951]|uniref:F-box domain-containing protein n=1 Tax=Zasmidium cellare ATCC 36951 TaxID=1080233 RepID=A0A6A6C1I0_ZASCE|nr:uncharacterized protein M409DRAFT_59655 [Zasmidium cellare ATCC 36951]KAF2160871.1 hypothetical protein M409DRAFT_59655 [Zasmidium cellare ATCC 36951]